MSYARYYLEKLIQVPFRIPALGYTETQTYIALVLAQAGLGEESEQFAKLLPRARECLSQPWNASVLDQKMAKEALFGQGNENLPPEISHAITLSQQIARILTDGTKGNPRQIKRFLNSMLLRNEIAEARGFGAAIKQPILAKVMLAESFNATFYDQLTRAAYASSDGKAKELAGLEKAVRVNVQSKEDAEKADSALEGSKDADEWAKSEWITAWAKCDPELADVDLRPYVFVTRDKRSCFGGAAGTSHLDPIVDALLGKDMAVRLIEPQLSKLSPLEAEQVFDAVQSRIAQGDDYSTRPSGLIALTKAKPALQRKLFTFLRDIPPAKVHGWVTTGFDKAFIDPGIKAEFAATIEKWVEGGQSLNSLRRSKWRRRKLKSMGTSAKYGGPGVSSALIPSFLEVSIPPAPPPQEKEDKQEGPQKEDKEEKPKPKQQEQPGKPTALPPLPKAAAPGRFKSSRMNFNSFADTRDKAALRKSLSSYVSKGTGGGRTATRRMGASIPSVGRAIDFVQGVARDGIDKALANLGLGNLVGQPAEQALAVLTDVFCPVGGPIDQAIAREAWDEAVLAAHRARD